MQMGKEKLTVPLFKKKNAKRVLIGEFLILGVLILSLVGSVLGFFRSSDHLDNRFTIGANTSEIHETFNNPGILKPEEMLGKSVQVRNTGSVPCYVRMYYAVEDPQNRQDLNITITDNWDFNKNDGYYYYKSVVEPGRSTTRLFGTIKNTSQEDVKDLNIICYEETVQAEGFANAEEAFKLGVKK